MIIMAVDLGLVRTGIAVSDEGGGFAFPKEVITEKDENKLISKVSAAAREYGAGRIVVGLPRNMDGTSGERALACERIAKSISEISGIETVLYDERCTTVTAHTYLSMNNVRGRKRKERVDAVAATVILEDYLRSIKK
ncbi:MAG: Holliday junction resolvase RuvX [Clostridia bacterium]|nr:Holliday junction resolvase RuvX [Clostridia bacterium]